MKIKAQQAKISFLQQVVEMKHSTAASILQSLNQILLFSMRFMSPTLFKRVSYTFLICLGFIYLPNKGKKC